MEAINKLLIGACAIVFILIIGIVSTHDVKVNQIVNEVDNTQYVTLNNTIVKTEIVRETIIKEEKFNPTSHCISVKEPGQKGYVWYCNELTK